MAMHLSKTYRHVEKQAEAITEARQSLNRASVACVLSVGRLLWEASDIFNNLDFAKKSDSDEPSESESNESGRIGAKPERKPARKRKLRNPEFVFQKWIRERLNLTRTTAWKWMRVYHIFQDCPDCKNLQLSALYLLSTPSVPKEAREKAIKIAAKGGTISNSRAKALVESVKQAAECGKGKETYEKATRSPVEPPSQLKQLKKAWRLTTPDQRSNFVLWVQRQDRTFKIRPIRVSRPHRV